MVSEDNLSPFGGDSTSQTNALQEFGEVKAKLVEAQRREEKIDDRLCDSCL